MINDLEHRLRQELQGALVPHDARRADEMTTIAVQAAQLGARRPWAAPAVAAAAVLAAGGGIAAAAASGGSDHGSAPAGGSPTSAAPTSRTLPTWARPSCVTVRIVGLDPGNGTVTVPIPTLTVAGSNPVTIPRGRGTLRLEVLSCPEVSVRPIPLITGHS